MKYRRDSKSGKALSVLGFGCMRFPRGLNAKIDAVKAERLVLSAIDGGINYFDTAYIYGGSEQVLGGIIKRNKGVREKIHLATKLPLYQCKAYGDFDRIFNEQLERLNTDRIDYYLIHNLSAVSRWDTLRRAGIEKWLAGKKAEGRIGQAGFSFHGIRREFLALLEEYDWDFCQIQYNYMNENDQAGREGLLRAHEKGLPVFVMEPLLGGTLASGLPKKAAKLLEEPGSGLTPAARALRWLWDHEEVTMLLSGMNSGEQLRENLKTAETAEAGMMSREERERLLRAAEAFREAYRIPCTGCNYCLPCPNAVNIPGSFAAYNMSYASGYISGMLQYILGTAAASSEKNYSGRNCVKCGSCEKRCPQNIGIVRSLEDVTKRMEPFWFKAAMKLFHKLRV